MTKKPDHKRKTDDGKTPRKPSPEMFDWRKFQPAMAMDREEGQEEDPLVEELTTYRDNLKELLKRAGSYVLIKGKTFDIFDDQESALQYAWQTYGDVPVLVKKIVAREQVQNLGGATL